MICPVCKMWCNDSQVCGTCGFDPSKCPPWFMACILAIAFGAYILIRVMRGM